MESNNRMTQLPQDRDDAPALTMEYVLMRIDQVLEDTRHVHKAIDEIARLSPMEQSQLSQMPDSRGEAISQIAVAREETNRKLLDIFRVMYDDLKVPTNRDDNTVEKLRMLTDMFTNLGVDLDDISGVLESIVERVFPK